MKISITFETDSTKRVVTVPEEKLEHYFINGTLREEVPKFIMRNLLQSGMFYAFSSKDRRLIKNIFSPISSYNFHRGYKRIINFNIWDRIKYKLFYIPENDAQKENIKTIKIFQ